MKSSSPGAERSGTPGTIHEQDVALKGQKR